MKKIRTFWASFIAILFCASLTASAQDASTAMSALPADKVTGADQMAAPRVKPTWGLTSSSARQVAVATCMPVYSSTTFSIVPGSPSRTCTGGNCNFVCNMDLPTGAKIVYFELNACDTTNTSGAMAILARAPYDNPAAVTTIATAESGVDFNGGCGWFPDWPLPETVDNLNNTYFVQVYIGGGTSASAIRFLYTLQISPAPGAATFSDVPVGSTWFQYVEALAASGITTGYGDGTFGPNNYVTRGQMAAFLSRALGLHWPY